MTLTFSSALGRPIGKFLSDFLTTGKRDWSSLTQGFDLTQFNKRQRVRSILSHPLSLHLTTRQRDDSTGPLDEDAKQELFKAVMRSIDQEIGRYFTPANWTELFLKDKAKFYEVFEHYEALEKREDTSPEEKKTCADQIRSLRRILKEQKRTVPLCLLTRVRFVSTQLRPARHLNPDFFPESPRAGDQAHLRKRGSCLA